MGGRGAMRAADARVSLGLLVPKVLRKGLSPLQRRGRVCCPPAAQAMVCPSTREQSKGHLPSPHDGLQLFSQAGKAQGGLYGAFVGSAMHGRASRYGTLGAAAKVVHAGHALSGAFRQMSRRLVAPSSLHQTDLPLPCWVAGIPPGAFPLKPSAGPAVAAGTGGRNQGPAFFLPLSLTAGVLERRTTKVFMDPCECGSPDGLG
ncbi:hypothetical protein H6P81_016043 [Aristolochia fimbriata]|uniref:Uncharacterized protein n=1 Tax=Aristolochia fimbriata TaxID=158543 RepID=A0AAV7E7M9_ARIFI|nr:hypothetical protein H6P81_016043 [Aristolochia fimbriata]